MFSVYEFVRNNTQYFVERSVVIFCLNYYPAFASIAASGAGDKRVAGHFTVCKIFKLI